MDRDGSSNTWRQRTVNAFDLGSKHVSAIDNRIQTGYNKQFHVEQNTDYIPRTAQIPHAFETDRLSRPDAFRLHDYSKSPPAVDSMDPEIANILSAIGFGVSPPFAAWAEFQNDYGEGMEPMEIVYTYFLREFANAAHLPFDELCAAASLNGNIVREFLAPVPEITICRTNDDCIQWRIPIQWISFLQKKSSFVEAHWYRCCA